MFNNLIKKQTMDKRILAGTGITVLVTTIVSGGYKSKDNALKDCHQKNLELENSLKAGYIPDVVFGGKFKVIKITCNIEEVE